MQPSGHSYFEPGRHTAPPSYAEPDDPGAAALRTAVARSRTRFLFVTGGGWVATVGLPPLVGLPSGTAVAGELTLGTLLFAAQAGLLLAMTVLFQREQHSAYRRWHRGPDATTRSADGGRGR